MLIEMNFHVIVNKTNNEIQLSENHDLIVANLVLMNNFYFLNVAKNSLMQVNIISKKSNHKQQQNAVRFIKI